MVDCEFMSEFAQVGWPNQSLGEAMDSMDMRQHPQTGRKKVVFLGGA